MYKQKDKNRMIPLLSTVYTYYLSIHFKLKLRDEASFTREISFQDKMRNLNSGCWVHTESRYL